MWSNWIGTMHGVPATVAEGEVVAPGRRRGVSSSFLYFFFVFPFFIVVFFAPVTSTMLIAWRKT